MAGRELEAAVSVVETAEVSEAAADGELAAALADSAEQFAGLLTWAAQESGFLDHGEREEAISREGRELVAVTLDEKLRR